MKCVGVCALCVDCARGPWLPQSFFGLLPDWEIEGKNNTGGRGGGGENERMVEEKGESRMRRSDQVNREYYWSK